MSSDKMSCVLKGKSSINFDPGSWQRFLFCVVIKTVQHGEFGKRGWTWLAFSALSNINNTFFVDKTERTIDDLISMFFTRLVSSLKACAIVSRIFPEEQMSTRNHKTPSGKFSFCKLASFIASAVFPTPARPWITKMFLLSAMFVEMILISFFRLMKSSISRSIKKGVLFVETIKTLSNSDFVK